VRGAQQASCTKQPQCGMCVTPCTQGILDGVVARGHVLACLRCDRCPRIAADIRRKRVIAAHYTAGAAAMLHMQAGGWHIACAAVCLTCGLSALRRLLPSHKAGQSNAACPRSKDMQPGPPAAREQGAECGLAGHCPEGSKPYSWTASRSLLAQFRNSKHRHHTAHPSGASEVLVCYLVVLEAAAGRPQPAAQACSWWIDQVSACSPPG
jgi:hypothetical protein